MRALLGGHDNRWADQYYDSDDPPFFKHFLRCDCTSGELRIRCFVSTRTPAG